MKTFEMNHPYSGAASYIYANGRTTPASEANVMSNGYSYKNTQWISVTPSAPVSKKVKPLSPWISDYNSADSASPFAADLRSHKFEIFSTSSHGKSAMNSQSAHTEPPPFVYKSIMITFDSPSETAIARRRQMRALKRLLRRFRRGVSRIFSPSWINTPHPRLSMIR